MIHNLFISKKCNLSCSFCFAHNIRQQEDNQKAILDKASTIESDTVMICGGEPFYDWEWLKLVISKIPKNVRKVINSNGQLFKKEYTPWLNENKIELMLSIDGFEKGERPLSSLELDEFSEIDSLHVNQILWFPEDIENIHKTLNPKIHSVCLDRFMKNFSPEDAEELSKKIPRYVWFDKVDDNVFSKDGTYNEITTFQTGKTYQSSEINQCKYCQHFENRIGKEQLQILRGRNE